MRNADTKVRTKIRAKMMKIKTMMMSAINCHGLPFAMFIFYFL